MTAPISLRPATATDEELILGWRNDPYIVERSSSRRLVSREEHAAWYPRALASPDCLMFVILIGAQAAGIARLDRQDGSTCIITVYLLEGFTGRGFGVAAIEQSSKAAFEKWELQRIIACVRCENAAGRRAFAKAGYSLLPAGVALCPADHVCMAMSRLE